MSEPEPRVHSAAEGRRSARSRGGWLLFLIVLASVLAYALWIDGSNDAVLRSFLRSLFRAIV